jgi:hypothetical protein
MRVWSGVRRAGHLPENLAAAIVVHEQSRDLCFIEHPLQCELGQPAFGLRISATDIAVHTGEPDLFHVPGAVRLRRVPGHPPEMAAEERAALVDGNRVAPDLNVGVVRHVWQLQRIFHPSDRAHGVPDAHEPRIALGPGHRPLEVPREIEVFADGIRVAAVRAPRALDRHHHANRVRHERIVALQHEAV